MKYRGLVLLSLPAAGLLALGVLVLARAPEGEPARGKPTAASLAPFSRPAVVPPSPVVISKPAPAGTVSAAMDDARQRATFQNYRAALATGNRTLAQALRDVLKRDRDAYVRLARDEAAKAPTPRDRELTLKALETLER